MKTSDFYFKLPEHLIAQFPAQKRSESRLMVLYRDSETIEHRNFSDLPDILTNEHHLVFNNSRVKKVRLLGESEYGGKVEFFIIEERDPTHAVCLVSKAKKQKPGKKIIFPDGLYAVITEEEPGTGKKVVQWNRPLTSSYLNQFGHMPLPPYIKREDQKNDMERYQTVYSKTEGSLAAPTAGLHFDHQILERLRAKGCAQDFLTLHVGLGTFLPVRTEKLDEHNMHEERYEISESTAVSINKAKNDGKKITAVGTTAVRTLESAWTEIGLAPGEAGTRIFIYPPYDFRCVDVLLTNFHTPESTLLMLVSAFAGREFILEAYKKAVEKEYRFFSYGDAMLIL